MEQRIGTSSQPLDAGVNPAHIPGLTAPEKDAGPEDAVEPEEAAPVEDAAPEETPAEEASEAQDAEDAEAADGPVFEAADRRARIVADARGVRLSLDDEKCEFRWDEIGAIETESPRFGKRFTVTVHTPDRRWYPIEIEAKSKSQHKEWDSQLDEVLDAYFEEDAD
ncbi:hypothetical protein [Streptomyces sp. KR55]|uniref:hypothetical protein n=1 Tax=Streptomyces sp. KR55 TaxID=3457425 RepID=UPI003FD6BDD7